MVLERPVPLPLIVPVPVPAPLLAELPVTEDDNDGDGPEDAAAAATDDDDVDDEAVATPLVSDTSGGVDILSLVDDDADTGDEGDNSKGGGDVVDGARCAAGEALPIDEPVIDDGDNRLDRPLPSTDDDEDDDAEADDGTRMNCRYPCSNDTNTLKKPRRMRRIL